MGFFFFFFFFFAYLFVCLFACFFSMLLLLLFCEKCRVVMAAIQKELTSTNDLHVLYVGDLANSGRLSEL